MQSPVNFYFMPGLKLRITRFHPRVKDLLTILLMLACIVLLVSLSYIVQTIFYRTSRSAVTVTGLHKIIGITNDDVFDLSGSEASGYGNPMKLFVEGADPANGIDPS